MSATYSEIKILWAELDSILPLTQCLVIDVDNQTLNVFQSDNLTKSYSISTAKNGLGNEEGSYKTPYGFHNIAEKIGDGQPINMLFKARQATGEIAQINHQKYAEQDTITTRILWLSGLQETINLSGSVDTKQRYIYIHGTADEEHLGHAVSHGCIRMNNSNILELFEMINDDTIVYIS